MVRNPRKVLVMSDSHGRTKIISRVLEQNIDGVDMVVHLGDFWFDMEPFLEQIKERGKEAFVVRGNVDETMENIRTSSIPEVLFVEIGGVKVMLTHGHIFEVHSRLDKLKKASISSGVRIVLFGHTHYPFAHEMDGIFFFNPGALKDGLYGVVSIDESVSHEHIRVKV